MTAVNSMPPFWDRSGRPKSAYRATSSVAAGVSSAFIDLDLTAGPSEARPAGTGVATLTGVATSGSIHAGLVVGAVVEIWRDTAAHVDKPQPNNWQDKSGSGRMAFCLPAHLTLYLLLFFPQFKASVNLFLKSIFFYSLPVLSF